METDTLNILLTSAIGRAEQLEARGIRSASQTWAEVSSLEEELARVIPASEAEGRIARRGAVRAALKAGDYDRAHGLADAYLAEAGAIESFRLTLQEILDEDDAAITRGFRYAAKYYTPSDARKLARRFREKGPFGLAA